MPFASDEFSEPKPGDAPSGDNVPTGDERSEEDDESRGAYPSGQIIH